GRDRDLFHLVQRCDRDFGPDVGFRPDARRDQDFHHRGAVMLGVLAKRLTLAAATAVWMPAAALAQFAGDVFFLTPSVAVQEGQTGELDLAFFTAADPFGVAQMTVTWDPAQMEVE